MSKRLLCLIIVLAVVWAAPVAYAQQAQDGSLAVRGSVIGSTISIEGVPYPKLEEAVRNATRPLEQLSSSQQQVIALLQEKLDLNQRQVRAALDIVGEKGIPPEQLGARLVEIAEQFRALRARVVAQSGESPQVATLAKEALDQGNLGRAEKLLAVARDQVRAVGLVDVHQPEQALHELRKIEQILSELLNEDMADTRLIVQQGYVYKTYAQAFMKLGDKKNADIYAERAFDIFSSVNLNVSSGGDLQNIAGTINGLGNIYHSRGDYTNAISSYKIATRLLPSYAYAWHDMFLAYLELAKLGDVNISEMRNALDKLRQTGLDQPGLDKIHIARLEKHLKSLEQKKRPVR